MGAWSHTSFGNDAACDFVYDVKEAGEEAVVAAFDLVNGLSAADYLEASEASNALAAAELVAAAGGKPPAVFPEQAAAVVGRIKGHAVLKEPARRAAMRVLNSSELRDLWSEAESLDVWAGDVENLIERLK
jgi:hypothetical protein